MFAHLCFQRCDPPHLLLGDMALTRHFLTIYARLTLGRCLEYRQGRRAVSTPAHALFKLDISFSLVHSETCFVLVVLIPRFEGSVGVTADFPVQWPESEIPRFEPLFKGFESEGVICPCCLPLKLLAH